MFFFQYTCALCEKIFNLIFYLICKSTAMKLSFHRMFLSFEYLIASFVQLYLYCYSSHKILTASGNMSESVYFSKWYRIADSRIHKKFGQLIQILVFRARKPCHMTLGKLFPLTLDTFTSVNLVSHCGK